MTNVVHYIRAWSGRRADETPFCGSGGFMRTVAGNLLDSAGQPMQICPICRLIAAAPELLDAIEASHAYCSSQYFHGKKLSLREILDIQKAAIRKAKEEQP